MRESARDAPSLSRLVETTPCPDCGYERVTALPVTVSGITEGRATALDTTAEVDERGYLVCASCGLVQNDEAAIFGDEYREGLVDAVQSSARVNLSASAYQNHYDRLIRRHTSYDMRRGDLLARLAVPRVERDRTTFLAGVLYDTDALCSSLDIRAVLKDEILHAVETFFLDRSRERRGGVRYEAFICALAEAVLQRRAPARLSQSEGVRLWASFGVSATTRQRARERVDSWFKTSYWKGE